MGGKIMILPSMVLPVFRLQHSAFSLIWVRFVVLQRVVFCKYLQWRQFQIIIWVRFAKRPCGSRIGIIRLIHRGVAIFDHLHAAIVMG